MPNLRRYSPAGLLPFLAVTLLPFAVAVCLRRGMDVGWLLWLVSLPAVIRLTLRFGWHKSMLVGVLGAVPMLAFDPTDAARYLAQIVAPGLAAGALARTTAVRIRDGWWMSVMAVTFSAGIGVIVGRIGTLRDVVLPAGIPTGWVDVVIHRWEGFFEYLSIYPYIFERFQRFADLVEPTLWFGALVPLMGAAVAVSTRGIDLEHKDMPLRDYERDLALGLLLAGMALALVSSGVWASIGANIAVMSSIFFVLEGIDVVALMLRRWNTSRWSEILGWSLLVTQPPMIFVLQALGMGDIWIGLRQRMLSAQGKGSKS